MQLTINSQSLASELRLVNHVTPTKPGLPILTNVLLRAEMGTLSFFATDLEIGFRTSCPATITEPGIAAVPAKRLLDLLEQLPDASVSMIADKAHLRIACGAFKSRLQMMPSDDFPALPEVVGDPQPLPTAALQALISRVRYAISDKGKYTVNGALLTLTETVAALVATDGKRLSIATMPYHGVAATPVILPDKTLDALQTLFNSPMTFSQSERHLFFVAGSRLLVTRTLDGAFPSYERIVPRDSDKRAVVDRAALSAALRRVGQLSEENMACYLAFEESVVSITSSSAQAGDAAEPVPITYTGEPLKVCISWRYLLDFLEAAAGQTVTLEMKSDATPMLLTDGDAFINVVSLMRM